MALPYNYWTGEGPIEPQTPYMVYPRSHSPYPQYAQYGLPYPRSHSPYPHYSFSPPPPPPPPPPPMPLWGVPAIPASSK
ncbi:uncharacterized protein IL334_006746 [Kwoniella shivajii]|uniref:Uncharacterized protein n=1 Tax=Kwoniella shivajii TaxID=564305 RepID=A0ABZ1D8S3_9TREE|nr:hypothetical protein IL334_006746 [Kwoniella shivajii]